MGMKRVNPFNVVDLTKERGPYIPSYWFTSTPHDYSTLGKDTMSVITSFLVRNDGLVLRRVCRGWKHNVDHSVLFWLRFGVSTQDGLTLPQSVIRFYAMVKWEAKIQEARILKAEQISIKTKVKGREARIKYLEDEISMLQKRLVNRGLELSELNVRISDIKKEFGFKKKKAKKDSL